MSTTTEKQAGVGWAGMRNGVPSVGIQRRDVLFPRILHIPRKEPPIPHSLGRWMQRDPIGYVDGMSLYEYVGAERSALSIRMDTHGSPHTFDVAIVQTRGPRALKMTRCGRVQTKAGCQSSPGTPAQIWVSAMSSAPWLVIPETIEAWWVFGREADLYHLDFEWEWGAS